MTDPWLVLAVLMLEGLVGYPDWLHARVPHPVVWLGAMLDSLERGWNRSDVSGRWRRMRGLATITIVAGAAGLAGAAVQRVASHLPFSSGLIVVIATSGLAQRSLYDHVAAVARALEDGDFADARTRLARIVGRDVQDLDESAIAAASLESLSESFSDGVVAPVFWLTVGGLPGLFIYKALSTADSMIGHKEPRWKDFGWAAARSDDLLNLIPARLAGALIAFAGWGGWQTMWSDARKHASPNAGWPEAAMAGALNVRLGGAASYDGCVHERPTFGAGAGTAPTRKDLRRGLRVYLVACGCLWLVFVTGGALWRR